MGRAARLFVVLALLGIPAAGARLLCVGKACERADASSVRAPFCGLPADLRDGIAGGFYEGRSPDLLAVTGSHAVVGGSYSEMRAPWPSLASAEDEPRLPVVFSGTGVASGADLGSAELHDISETLAEIVGLERPTPDVRSGRALEDVASEETPRLVLQVVWKDVDSGDLEARPEAWPRLRSLADSGSWTFDATTRFLPFGEAAALTSVGTGGTPAEHGIVGSVLRENLTSEGRAGRLTRAWKGADSVIATWSDHLDDGLDQRPLIGVVGTEVADKGLTGGAWFPDDDRDVVRFVDRRKVVAVARKLLDSSAFGRDREPDVLAVALEGRSLRRLDRELGTLIESAERAARGRVAVSVVGIGHPAPPGALRGRDIEDAIEHRVAGADDAVEAVVPGGVYLDQTTMARLGSSDERLAGLLRELEAPDGRRLMADVFSGTAVAFARYC